MASLTINKFLDTLGVKLRVRRPSWDACDDSSDTVVMKLWFREEEPGTSGKSIRVWTDWKPGDKHKDPIGRAERRQSIAHLEAGRPTYAVMRYGIDRYDPDAAKYDSEGIRKLKGISRRPNGDIYVTVGKIITVDQFHTRVAGRPTIAQDIADIEDRYQGNRNATTRQALIQARLGQGRYRSELLAKWGGACAVTGCSMAEVLIASHVIAWSDPEADDARRLDPNNGLPLVATLDRLFDKHLIAFDPDKKDMHVSRSISQEHRELLGLPAPLRKKPSKEQAEYLRYHLGIFQARRHDDG